MTCPSDASNYTGANSEFNCVAIQPDGSGHDVWVRYGYNTSAGKGFGFVHFYEKHNVGLATATTVVGDSAYGEYQATTGRYFYGAYYVAPNGYISQNVYVFESRNPAPVADGNEMGIITAYCTGPSGEEEATCPNWVNNTL